MIIDAMDILYSEKVNGFCLVSSDSDFTKLATRLREAGMQVYGIGEKKTPSLLESTGAKSNELTSLLLNGDRFPNSKLLVFSTGPSPSQCCLNKAGEPPSIGFM